MNACYASGADSARLHKWITGATLCLALIWLPANLPADCCDSPTSYDCGALEGRVDCEGGENATVGIDADGNFIVAFRTPMVDFDNDIIVAH